jgi:signal peptidase II
MPLLRMAMGAMVVFGLDRLSKILIIHWLDLASARLIEVWSPYLIFRMAWNRGINFGVFKDHGSWWVLAAFALIVSLALTMWIRNKHGWIRPLAVGAIVGGALGNAFDRAVYGAVADYLNMSCCGIKNPYSFNVADVFIFCGAVVLIINGRTESQTVRRRTESHLCGGD